jgi:hypothetical protein
MRSGQKYRRIFRTQEFDVDETVRTSQFVQTAWSGILDQLGENHTERDTSKIGVTAVTSQDAVH